MGLIPRLMWWSRPEYFQVDGIPLLHGRTFVEQDDATAPRVVLVNQEFVHRFLQDHDPIGTQIQLDITALHLPGARSSAS